MNKKLFPPRSQDERETLLYKSRRFKVSRFHIDTPSAYYPTEETVGRLRKDILFGSLVFAAVTCFALFLYLDLWYMHEVIAMSTAIILVLLIGFNVSILQLDARGFPPRTFVGRAKTMRAVFNAITEAKAQTRMSRSYGDETEVHTDNDQE